LLRIDIRAALGSACSVSSFDDKRFCNSELLGSFEGGALLLSIDIRAALGSACSVSSFGDGRLCDSE